MDESVSSLLDDLRTGNFIRDQESLSRALRSAVDRCKLHGKNMHWNFHQECIGIVMHHVLRYDRLMTFRSTKFTPQDLTDASRRAIEQMNKIAIGLSAENGDPDFYSQNTILMMLNLNPIIKHLSTVEATFGIKI